MANEKIWKSVCNVNLQTQTVGADNEDKESKNWAYQLSNFLSGGAGNPLGAWEIVSASNGSTVGDSGLLTSPAAFTWANAGSAHSWFVAKKNILPPTGSSGNRYMWMTVDFEGAADSREFSLLFSHQRPIWDGSTTARPTSRGAQGSTYVHDDDSAPTTLYFKEAYDASYPNYFHGIMDTTGSFVILTTSGDRAGAGYPKNMFTLACIRLETPTSSSSDPFPVWLKHQYGANTTSYKGPWDQQLNTNYDGWNETSQAEGGNAMFWVDGTTDHATIGTQDGWSTQIFYPDGVSKIMDSIPLTGQYSDGTFPRLPLFSGQVEASKYCIRGRLPDITTGPGLADGFGYSTPGQGDIEAVVVGDAIMPFTASLLP